MKQDHHFFMARCKSLAQRGRGWVKTSPLVGSCIIHNSEIISENYYKKDGEKHSERQSIEIAVQKLNTKEIGEATLYVTLEPCCHHGRTPPCTDLIIESGIKKVVYGIKDPDTRVAGQGIAQLQSAGIEVIGPIDRAQFEWQNKGYISCRTKNRPWITLKKAIDRNGKIANEDGSPRTITSTQQDTWSHQRLRATHDAILVGVGTINIDNPKLNTRFIQNKNIDQEFYLNKRIILDSEIKINLDSNVVNGELATDTIIVIDNQYLECHPELVEGRKSYIALLQERGVTILPIPKNKNHFQWQALFIALMEQGISSILIEGGRKTWAVFEEAGYVDTSITLVG